MNLAVNSRLVIPSNEIQLRFSRSSGAGGQNVNKTSSRVEVVFDVDLSKTLTNFQKSLIKSSLKRKLIKGCICIVVQEHRTQYQNRKLALYKLSCTLRDSLIPSSKVRVRTKPTKASERRRVASKKKRGKIKQLRQSQINESI